MTTKEKLIPVSEVKKMIDETMKRYSMKSSDGGFEIKAHIGFEELKSKLNAWAKEIEDDTN